MKIINGINKIKRFKKPVVALGVFDGVHRGHRVILEAAVKKARSIKGTSIVLTFWPHPQKEESLYSLEHRLRLIAEIGIDVCTIVNFSKNFARISPEDFIKNILVKKLGAYYVYIGENFRFGKDAKGGFETLLRFSKIYNFKLKGFNIIKDNHRPISSTYIRSLIKKGKLKKSERLLNRSVSILGTVIRGDSLASRLGFPTANIDPHHEVIPPPAIYATRIIFDNEEFKGICYIGARPTLSAQSKRAHIEVHIFNFNKIIYGKYLDIRFVKKIRPDKRFASLEFLSKQIKKDVILAKKILSCH